MKRTFLTLSCFLALTIGVSNAQPTVVDTHPAVTISIIDPQTNQLEPVNSPDAILFKDAFVDLVNNSYTARLQMTKLVPGRKTVVINQVDPTNGISFQLDLQSRWLNQTNIIYSFVYNADQNKLFYFDQRNNSWVEEPIRDNNAGNLNNCFQYSRFVQAQYANNDVAQPLDASEMPDTSVATETAPPPLPDYDQPEAPGDDYEWQPGYWSYRTDMGGFYWVPGVWVAPPAAGLLWTPPYWGYAGGRYIFHPGYWGHEVGFYGGINYGFGYFGSGFYGGRWEGGHFHYNTAVLHVGGGVHFRYEDRPVIINTARTHVSFNGRGGVMAAPTPHEQQVANQQHFRPTPDQIRNQRAARDDRGQFAGTNGGRPANVASTTAPPPHAVNGPRDQRINPNMQNNGQRQQGGFQGGQRPDNFNRPQQNNPAPQNTPQQQNGGQRPDNFNRPQQNNPAPQSTPQQQNNGGQRPDNFNRPQQSNPAPQNTTTPQQVNPQQQNNNQRQQGGGFQPGQRPTFYRPNNGQQNNNPQQNNRPQQQQQPRFNPQQNQRQQQQPRTDSRPQRQNPPQQHNQQ